MSGKLKIGSLNVRGLGEKSKRKAIFNFFRKSKLDIILVQETHLGDSIQRALWEKEWGGPVYSSNGSTNARGVMILINPKCQIDEKVTDV